MITIEFKGAEFKEKMGRVVAQAKNPRNVLVAAGRVVNEQLRSHFIRKDRTQPNKLSDRRSDFWFLVSRSVQKPYVLGNTVVVAVNHPAIAQKVFGGTIKAKAAGALTIPVEERAYGRTAHTFEQETGLKLFLLRTGKGAFGNAVLAVQDKNAKGFTVEYILTKEVNQKPDPDALPQESVLEAAIITACQKTVDNQNAGEAKPE